MKRQLYCAFQINYIQNIYTFDTKSELGQTYTNIDMMMIESENHNIKNQQIVTIATYILDSSKQEYIAFKTSTYNF